MDGGAWKAAVHRVAEGRTQLSDFSFTFYFHALEKEMATHSSVLAWRIPGTGEPGGLPSMGSHRVGHNWSNLAAAAAQWIYCVVLTSALSAKINKMINFSKQFSYSYTYIYESESEVTQLCVTLCNPMDCSPPGSSVHGILQARILEWVAISSPGNLPNPGIEFRSPTMQADSLLSEPQGNYFIYILSRGFPDGSVVKNLPANAGDTSSIPGSGNSSGGGSGNPIQ